MHRSTFLGEYISPKGATLTGEGDKEEAVQEQK